MSFIPILGVIFGIVAMIWGLATKKTGGKTVASIGAAGIVLTAAWYLAFSQVSSSKVTNVADDTAQVLQARHTITTLAYAIEFYKAQTGEYPANLDTLSYSMPPAQALILIDPMIARSDPNRFFHYELVDAEHYVLLGKGADDQPFTSDDILPEVAVKPKSDVGLLLEHRWRTAGSKTERNKE